MYCVRCGKKLPGQYNKCHRCREDAREGAWYCPYCGSGVRERDKKCEICKRKLDLSPEMYVKTPAGKQRSRAVTLILAFALGFTGLHFRYLGFNAKFIRRILWSAISLFAAVAALIAFRNGIEPAFTGAAVNIDMLESMSAFIWGFAILVTLGALSFLLAFAAGIIDGITIASNRRYQDADGEYLTSKKEDR